MAKVMFCIPNEGTCSIELIGAWTQMLCTPEEHQIEYRPLDGKPIENVRNKAVKAFLESDNDFLLFMDSDNPPREGCSPIDLVSLDKDIIGLPTLIWRPQTSGKPPWLWNVFDWLEDEQLWMEHNPKGGLQEVDAVGTGCILIARRVLEKVKPAFITGWHDDGTRKHGSDLLFCKRAKDAGFRVWAHYDYYCRHFKALDLAEVYAVTDWRDIRHAESPRWVETQQPEYWDRRYAAEIEERGADAGRWYEFSPRIVDMVSGSVVEFGCGPGRMLQAISRSPRVERAWGIDLSGVAVRHCQSLGLHAAMTFPHAHEQSGVAELHPPRWDYAVAIEVMEHLEDDVRSVGAVLEHCERLVASVPYDCLPPGLEPEHRRVYTPGSIRARWPGVVDVHDCGNYLLIECSREKMKAQHLSYLGRQSSLVGAVDPLDRSYPQDVTELIG